LTRLIGGHQHRDAQIAQQFGKIGGVLAGEGNSHDAGTLILRLC